MKLTLLFILFSVGFVFAGKTYSQTKMLNLKIGKTTVKEALSKIEDQSEFYFMFSSKIINVNREVMVDIENRKIDEVLNGLFEGTDVEYTIKDRIIVLTTPEVLSEGSLTVFQQKSISGKVTDSGGLPLPGVTVVVKGTTLGTVTNADGSFTLSNIPDNAVLQFSFVGMKGQEIVVGNQTSINVSMAEETIGLDEVVAVGYGVQKRINLTGSVSSVKFDKEIENRPITNASQALGGIVSGVWVSQNSGEPGNDAAQIRVRGWGTLNNANPLIIVDGVEGSFEQINPNDIESISVLKDAASAAIYGTKAANGVILITTKMGQRDEKMAVNLNSYFGVQSLGRRYDMITNSADHMRLTNQAIINNGGSSLFPDDMILSFETSTDKYKYPSTDWFDVLFENALIHEHNVSVTGGSKQTSSFLSLNYLNQDGMVMNTNSERYGMRTNVESTVNEWFKVNGRMSFSRKVSNQPYNSGYSDTGESLPRVFNMLEGAAPFIAPYTSDGRLGSVQAIKSDGTLLYDNRNPLVDASNGLTQIEENYLTVNASMELKIIPDLVLKSTAATSGTWRLRDNYNTEVYGYTDTGIQTLTKNLNREGFEIARYNRYVLSNNFFTTLSYNKNVNDNHNLSTILGVQLESFTAKTSYSRRSNPPKIGLNQVDAGTTGYVAEGNMSGLRMFSYFGRLNYSFKDKYLFEANLRADASSRFKEGNRWGIFPGFSIGWRIIDEGFMANQTLFSNLKLRASWGQLGNQSISGFWPYLYVIEQNNVLSYSYKGTFAPGAAVTTLVDEDITWETTTSKDIGLELGFLNNKLNIEFDYFNKKTSDILVQLPIPLIMGGLTPPFENVGEMVNNGFEFVLNYKNQPVNDNKFGYNLSANLTYIENEVTKFQGGKSPDQLYLIREGYSYRTLYGYKNIGIYQTNEEAAEHMHSNGYKPVAGNLKFEDLNNDGRLGFEDKQDIGNTIPKLTYGFNANFNYKGFDFSFLFQGTGGVYSYVRNVYTALEYENLTITKRWLDGWSTSNTDSKIPMARFDNTWDNYVSSYWARPISFLKLKNIQLGYEIPEQLTSKLGMERIYFYANGQNIFSLVNKDYEGFDPEKSTFDSGSRLYPAPRIISFGINLNF